MKKILKNNLIGFILGIIITNSISVFAANYLYRAEQISYESVNVSTNVKDALDGLYDLVNLKSKGDATAEDIVSGKTAIVQGEEITGTGISSGYVAYFAGNKSITTSTANLPISYFNENYGTKSGDTITITKPGTYRVLGFAQHSPLNNSCTTMMTIYKSGTNIGIANNNYNSVRNHNSTFKVENNPVNINATYKADCNVSQGSSSAVLIIIKEA